MSHLALVMYGGGMRGAYGAGVIDALVDLVGYEDIGMAIGTSAGAANAAGLAAGMKESLQEIWTRRLDLRRFINPLRPRWITDTDYLMEIFRAEGLSNERIRTSPLRILIATTHFLTGATHYFNNHDDIVSVVHASISMPLLCRTPIIIGNEPHLDGGITTNTNTLITRALSEGADRVIALDLSSPLRWVGRIGMRCYAWRKTAGLRAVIQNLIDAPYPEHIDAFEGRVYLIRPLNLLVSRMTRIPQNLARAYAIGKKETQEDKKLRKFLGI